jgi:hypothetical protein
LSVESMELIVDAFEALLMCMPCRRASNVLELAVGEVGDVVSTLCDGGAYAFSNFEVPTGLIERSRGILGSGYARRILGSHADHAARLVPECSSL